MILRLAPMGIEKKTFTNTKNIMASEEDLIDALIDSARYNDVEDLVACIEAGASVNGQNESGSTGTLI